VSAPADRAAHAYDASYEAFDSSLMRQVRQRAYGEDIGQHSWVTATELRADISRLRLSPSSRLLDVGCGPGGPLTFVLRSVGCRGTGIESSPAALFAGRRRAVALGVDGLATFVEADADQPMPVAGASFDAAMSLDVVLHLRDRAAFFREVARTLVPGGRFLFTDAGVLSGAISDEEVSLRSAYGHTQLSAPGFNERALALAGLRLLEREDRTDGLLTNAVGRLEARLTHRDELERAEGAAGFDRQQRYLETVVALSRRGAVSRPMYLAEAGFA
jgi:SAM-dependent methyltransferase